MCANRDMDALIGRRTDTRRRQSTTSASHEMLVATNCMAGWRSRNGNQLRRRQPRIID